MKIKNGFELMTVCGENIIISHGEENINFTKVISLNESAAYLWQKVEGKEFTEEILTDYLLEEYEIDRETASKDVTALVESWYDAGLIKNNH